jgi:transposase
MAHPLSITIKESISDLRVLQRKHGPHIQKRLELLVVIKKHEARGGLSKRALSEKTGMNHNSIVKWRNRYLQYGIARLLSDGRTGFKPSILTKGQHQELKCKLEDKKGNILGYKELLAWVQGNINENMKYTTLYEYCRRHFGTKIKVARKSHASKDDGAVEAFKKTSAMR